MSKQQQQRIEREAEGRFEALRQAGHRHEAALVTRRGPAGYVFVVCGCGELMESRRVQS